MVKISDHGRWRNPNCVAHAYVGELVAFAETVDDGQADAEHAGDFAQGQQAGRVVQQECSKTASKPCQKLLIRTVVGRCRSLVIAITCHGLRPPAIPLSGVHTAGVAGSNPAAPTTKPRKTQRIQRIERGCRVPPILLHDTCMTAPRVPRPRAPRRPREQHRARLPKRRPCPGARECADPAPMARAAPRVLAAAREERQEGARRRRQRGPLRGHGRGVAAQHDGLGGSGTTSGASTRWRLGNSSITTARPPGSGRTTRPGFSSPVALPVARTRSIVAPYT